MLKKIEIQLKVLAGKIRWHINGGYKPRDFWDKWSRTFMNDLWQVKTHPQHKWLLGKIDIDSGETILEVGCGFGRNIKYLMSQGIRSSRITGVDLSPEMIRKARRYLGKSHINLKTANVLGLPFTDKEFDIVFTHGVLMHVEPRDLKKALQEIVRVSKNKIIFIEQNYGGNEYTFIHDYKKLLNSLKLNIVEYKVSKKLGLDLIYVEIR